MPQSRPGDADRSIVCNPNVSLSPTDALPMIARNPWTYGSGIRNRAYLNDNASFEDLIDDLCIALESAEPSSVCFQIEPEAGRHGGDDALLGRLECRRPSWRVSMGQSLLDKFFNGRMGIRAQYYESPYHGQSMNRHLLARIQDRLVELAQTIDRNVDTDLLTLSLSASSAKAWISERDLAGRKIIRAGDLTLVEDEIQNDWLDLARSVKNGSIGAERYHRYCAAINGARAPLPDQFEVKGAWITRLDRSEYVTPDKRDRDCQLFMFGFT